MGRKNVVHQRENRVAIEGEALKDSIELGAYSIHESRQEKDTVFARTVRDAPRARSKS